jgi:dienelactone hydrolase
MKSLKSLITAGSVLFSLLSAPALWAGEVVSKTVEYTLAQTALEGWLAVPKGVTGKVPGILVIHDWTGVQPYSKGRADQLAGLGYVALVADIYGKGIRPANPKESGAEAGKYKTDRALFRERLLAGLAELKKQPNVDPDKVIAIGYCFGGTGVLELARAGAEVKGVVSFHGGLDSPTPADGKNIKAKVLILHGADDPYVPAAGITAMTAEFNAAKVDWQMVSYSGAVHSFTHPGAGTDNSKGAAYNAAADARSWVAMRSFFDEIFAPAPASK